MLKNNKNVFLSIIAIIICCICIIIIFPKENHDLTVNGIKFRFLGDKKVGTTYIINKLRILRDTLKGNTHQEIDGYENVVYVIVYDLTNAQSFKNVDELFKRINHPKQHYIILVGNKRDQINLNFDISEAKTKAINLNCYNFIEIDNENIDLLFNDMLKLSSFIESYKIIIDFFVEKLKLSPSISLDTLILEFENATNETLDDYASIKNRTADSYRNIYKIPYIKSKEISEYNNRISLNKIK